MGHDVTHQLEGGAAGAVNGLLGMIGLAGVLLFGVALVRKGNSTRVRLAGAVLVGSVVLLLAGPALPVAEGLWIIPASVAIGLSLAAVALGALRAPTPVTVPEAMTVAACGDPSRVRGPDPPKGVIRP